MPSSPESIVRFRADGLKRTRAIVFVHGLWGDPRHSWGEFPRYLRDSTRLEDWDVLSIRLPRKARLALAANEVRKVLAAHKEYTQLAFITHSVGGLVVQLALLDDPALADRASHAFFFALPAHGIRFDRPPFPTSRFIAGIFHPGFLDLHSESALLTSIRERWATRFSDTSLKSWIIGGTKDSLVPLESLAGVSPSRRRLIEGTHSSLIKPQASYSTAVTLVIHGLLDEDVPRGSVVPTQALEKLDAKVASHVFDVFLFADEADTRELREIANRLENRGIRPWLIEDRVPPGKKWFPVFQAESPGIRAIAICFGKAGIGVRVAERQKLANDFAEKGRPVLPVFLGASPATPGDLPIRLTNSFRWISAETIPWHWKH